MATVERAIPVGGASLNFSVVGGTVQPTNPKENTIWVNTATAIGEWQFAAAEPAVRADGSALVIGDVWIKIGKTSNLKFNALKKNGIIVGPQNGLQWDGSKWVQKDVAVYVAGEWMSCGLYLYKDGTYYSALLAKAATVNGSSYGNSAGTLTSYDNYFEFKTDTTSQRSCLAYFADKQDLTNISFLRVKGKLYRDGQYSNLCIWSGSNIPGDMNQCVSKVAGDTTVPSAETTYTIDTSTLTGEYYIGFGLYNNGTMTYAMVSEVELLP